MSDRCPAMPPGMHPHLRETVGAQYHRCRKDADHDGLCVNNDGQTWAAPDSTPDDCCEHIDLCPQSSDVSCREQERRRADSTPREREAEPCEHDTLGCGWREPHDRHTKLGDGRPCCGWPPRCQPTEREAGDAEVAAVAEFLHERFAPDYEDHWRDLDEGQRRDTEAWDMATALAPLLAEREAKVWEQGAKAGHHSPLTWFALRQVNPYRATLAPETRETVSDPRATARETGGDGRG